MAKYKLSVNRRESRARSKRLRELGGSGVGSGSTVVEINGVGSAGVSVTHSHANKPTLDKLHADDESYVWLDQLREVSGEGGESSWRTVREKSKSGWADESGHAQMSDDSRRWRGEEFGDWLDQPVRKKDAVEFLRAVLREGVQLGESFASGMTGFGGRIDGKGRGELESLSLRSFLEVPELRYNRVEIQAGNQWRAPGGGIIESVTPDRDEMGNTLGTGTVKLHLEDGEIGTIAVDDICQGIFHDEITSENNETSSADDGKGNFKFAGFFTSYFRVTEILDSARHVSFRYALRPVSDSWTQRHHPCAAMHFVSYGNFVNADRQSSRYSTLTYERFLTGVNGWEFGVENIGAQFGDLSNLRIFGLEMRGYSAYLNNIYMSGTIRQFETLPLRMETDTDGDSFLGLGESLHVRCRVMRGWDDVTGDVTRWVVTRDSGDAADDAAWGLREKAMGFCGEITLSHDPDPTLDDLGNGRLPSTLFTFTAYLGDGNREEDTAQFQLII